MPCKSDSHGFFRLALEINRGCVEIVDSVCQGVIDQVVDILLVHDALSILILLHGEPHATVTEQRDLVSVAGIGAEFHLTGLKGIRAVVCCYTGYGFDRFLRSTGTGHGNCSGDGCAFTCLFEKFSSVNILIHGVVRLYGGSGNRLQ